MSDDRSPAPDAPENSSPHPSAAPALLATGLHESDGREDTSLKWPKELGGPKGREPTRYGDWERNGRCSDF